MKSLSFLFFPLLLSMYLTNEEIKIRESHIKKFEFDDYIILYDNLSIFDIKKHIFVVQNIFFEISCFINDGLLYQKHCYINSDTSIHQDCIKPFDKDIYNVCIDKENEEKLLYSEDNEESSFLSLDKNKLDKDKKTIISVNKHSQ